MADGGRDRCTDNADGVKKRQGDMWPKRMKAKQAFRWKDRYTKTTSIERYKDRHLKNTFRKADTVRKHRHFL